MNRRVLGGFSLALINVAAILSIKNWPITAEYGLASVFYFVIAALIFFFPVSFVSAELATGWPERGGIYVWIKEAFGNRMAFLAVWLLWVENIIWYPTILSFIAGTLAYAIAPELVESKLYTYLCVILVFWLTTAWNLLGMRASGFLSSVSVIFGTLIPGALIIALAIFWYFSGNPIAIPISADALIPDLSSFRNMSLLVGVLLGFAGMEMSAVHAAEVHNPQKNYPKAILASALIIIILSILGSLAIAIVVPQKQIALHAGSMEAIATFLKFYKIDKLIPLISILVAFGAIGGMSTWTAGPSKALLAAATHGELPEFLKEINRFGMPKALLITQAIVVSIISTLFLLLPTINSSFWIMITLASQVYLIMYLMMFFACIKLRYTHPNTPRAYRLPMGKIGLFGINGIGILGAIFALVLGFFPPSQLEIEDLFIFEGVLLGGILICLAIPFLIDLCMKKGKKQ